jgi:hypothetical protein
MISWANDRNLHRFPEGIDPDVQEANAHIFFSREE